MNRLPFRISSIRLVELKRKYGLAGILHRGFSKFNEELQSRWRYIVRPSSYIFVYERKADSEEVAMESQARTTKFEDLQIARYTTLQDIPDYQLSELTVYRGEKAMRSLEVELDTRTVLWLCRINGRFAGMQRSRFGRDIAFWYVPLREQDLVIYATGTSEELRGRGVASTIMRHIVSHDLEIGGRAYIDCEIWNIASIRSIEKAGFKRIATMRPLSVRRSGFANRTQTR